jgi:hypothetical protein
MIMILQKHSTQHDESNQNQCHVHTHRKRTSCDGAHYTQARDGKAERGMVCRDSPSKKWSSAMCRALNRCSIYMLAHTSLGASLLKKSRKQSKVKHNTTQHNTTQHNTTQHNTTQHNTTQHNTPQHTTTQPNTTQHNTTQHNTTQHISTC